MSISRTLVINDLHIPFENPTLVKLVLDAFDDATKDSQIHRRILINGDLLDFYNINSHEKSKHPDVFFTLEDELIAGREFLEKLRERFKDAEIVFIFGNHEDRLDRFIVNNAKAFYNILTLEKMLTLEALDIEFYYYNYCYQLENTNLYIQHSPPSYSVNGARVSLLKKLDGNFIYGCTHRKDFACTTGHSGEVYTVYFNGWLGDDTSTPAHERVFKYAKGHQTWQHAASVVTVLDGKEFFVDQLEIKNNKLLLDGAIYEA